MSNLEVVDYDCVQPIVAFNSLAGNTLTPKGVCHEDIDTQLDIIWEEVEEMLDGFDKGNILALVDGAADTIVTVVGLLARLGLDPNHVMHIVNNANMSKFCMDEQEALESVGAYDNDNRYSNVHYIKDENTGPYIVKGYLPDGGLKILKSINFRAPEDELTNYLKEVGYEL